MTWEISECDLKCKGDAHSSRATPIMLYLYGLQYEISDEYLESRDTICFVCVSDVFLLGYRGSAGRCNRDGCGRASPIVEGPRMS